MYYNKFVVGWKHLKTVLHDENYLPFIFFKVNNIQKKTISEGIKFEILFFT